MNKSFLLALAAALLAAPLALAHNPAGTPKNYCEDPSEWNVHDYGPLGTGSLIALGQDGNILGDCNGDTIPADYDGHVEWALGGGWLSVDSGDGATSGTIFCYGEVGHHPVFGPITVDDVVFGQTVPFTVGADVDPGCGDFITDVHQDCVGTCFVTFPPGPDGAYVVYVGPVGVAGHITSP